jgi:divalent metal cation (Fe/Co/Zn/Cd) transporter
VLWVAFTGIIVWFSGVRPIYEAIRAALQPNADESLLVYSNRSGITFVVIVILIAAAYYVFQSLRNRARGIDQAMLYHEIPPD